MGGITVQEGISVPTSGVPLLLETHGWEDHPQEEVQAGPVRRANLSTTRDSTSSETNAEGATFDEGTSSEVQASR